MIYDTYMFIARKAATKKSATTTRKKTTTTRKNSSKKKATSTSSTSISSLLSKKDKKLLKKYPDPSRPKLPPPVLYYLGLEQDKYPSPKELANLWYELDDASKSQYKEKRAIPMAQYKEKLANYKLRQKENIDEWLLVARQLDKDKPPKSGYLGYIQENKSILKGEKLGQGIKVCMTCFIFIFLFYFVILFFVFLFFCFFVFVSKKQLAAQWNELDLQEKDTFKTKYSELYKEWKQRVATYYEK